MENKNYKTLLKVVEIPNKSIYNYYTLLNKLLNQKTKYTCQKGFQEIDSSITCKPNQRLAFGCRNENVYAKSFINRYKYQNII